MTEHTQYSTQEQIFNLLFEYGMSEGMPKIYELICNVAMKIQREEHLNASSYQRNDARRGYANGFKPKTLNTSVGTLHLEIPQVRNCPEPFYPSFLEKGTRFDQALKCSIAQMYLQGISTRKVSAVMQELCGSEVSSTQVSRLTSLLDNEFEQWRQRPLPPIAYLIVDATYMKVRIDGSVRDCAVLIAVGITRDEGKRMVLGTSCSLSEAEIHWRSFLSSLKQRGMGVPDGITSDAHEGIKAALKTVFTGVPWQRCQFHLQQNAQAYVPKHSMKQQVAQEIRCIFNSPSLAIARDLLDKMVLKYEKSAPQLSKWLENNIEEGLTFQNLNEKVRRRLRTSNMMENINKQLKRRTKVITLFPNTESILRIVCALLQEISDNWETSKTYINLN